MSESVKQIIASLALIVFGTALLDSFISLSKSITAGINLVYIWVGTEIAPNLVTNIVFDWRGYDTLGEALILVTAVVIVMLIFGRGKEDLGGK